MSAKQSASPTVTTAMPQSSPRPSGSDASSVQEPALTERRPAPTSAAIVAPLSGSTAADVYTAEVKLASKIMDAALKAMAKTLSLELSPPMLADVYDQLTNWSTYMEQLVGNAKGRIKSAVLDQGRVTTEKGSRTLSMGGWDLSIRPHKTGTDGKKLEALLRAKGLDPGVAMRQTISYAPDAEKISAAIVAGKLTDADVAACAYDLNWAVQSPKRSKEAAPTEEDYGADG